MAEIRVAPPRRSRAVAWALIVSKRIVRKVEDAAGIGRRIVRADSGDLELISEESTEDRTRFSSAELARVGRDVQNARPTTERVVERRVVVEECAARRRATDKPESRL